MMKGMYRRQACGGARAAPDLGGESLGAPAGAVATRVAARGATAAAGESDRTAILDAPGDRVAFPAGGKPLAGASCWQHCGTGAFSSGRS